MNLKNVTEKLSRIYISLIDAFLQLGGETENQNSAQRVIAVVEKRLE